MDSDNIVRNYSYLNDVAMQIDNSSASFQVHYWGINPNHRDNPVHKHSFFEICYVLDGEGTYLDQDMIYPLHKDTLFMSRPEVIHQIRSEKGMYLLYVAFELDEFRSEETVVRCFQQLASSDRIVLHDAERNSSALAWKSLLEYFKAPDPMARPYVRSAAISLLLSFYSTFKSHLPSSEMLPTSYKPSAHIMNRAIRFVNDNLAQSLTLAKVADYLHLSSRHLSRLFHNELGISYIEYVQQEKLRRAVHFLKHSTLSIQKIADQTGFNSVHFFTRSFSRRIGIPPGKIREEHSN